MSATLELMTVTACGSMHHSAQLNTQVVVRKAVHIWNAVSFLLFTFFGVKILQFPIPSMQMAYNHKSA